MNNYKFRISGSDTTVDIVRNIINTKIGDHIVGSLDYKDPVTEYDGMVVYGHLRTNTEIAAVRRNFEKAFSPDYIAAVDPD